MTRLSPHLGKLLPQLFSPFVANILKTILYYHLHEKLAIVNHYINYGSIVVLLFPWGFLKKGYQYELSLTIYNTFPGLGVFNWLFKNIINSSVRLLRFEIFSKVSFCLVKQGET